MQSQPTSILIVARQPILQNAIKTALTGLPEVNIVGIASTGGLGVSLFQQFHPDVVIFDLPFSDTNSLKTLAQIAELGPRTRILAMADERDQANILALIQNGVLGYFPKDLSLTQFVEAVRKVADGIPYLPSLETLQLFESLRHRKNRSQPPNFYA